MNKRNELNEMQSCLLENQSKIVQKSRILAMQRFKQTVS